MRKTFAIVAAVAALAALAAAFAALRVARGRTGVVTTETPSAVARASNASTDANAGRRAPVVVELFTSEGCSSCPPADALLARLEREQPVEGAEVIALAQHVDYWNGLGWADPFSSRDSSARQGDYAAAFGKGGVYTPQMIVDGREDFPGGESGKAFETIARAAREPKAEVNLSRASGQENDADALRLSVRVERLPSPAGDADVLLALTEDDLASDVARGENAGSRLTHVGVVRTLTKVGSVGAATPTFDAEPTVALDKSWRRDKVRAVVFVQERASKRVVGAATLKPF